MEQSHPLCICVGVVGVVLREVVEPLAVLIDNVGALLYVQKLLQLVSHEAHENVVQTESLMKLNPRDLVAAILKSGGIVRPPESSDTPYNVGVQTWTQ
jgi:hypothetical protein